MKRCSHNDDDEFLDRVRSARSVGWSGPKADIFWHEDARELVRILGSLFPGLDRGEVLYWVWEAVEKLDLDRAEKCPRGWVMKTVKFRLQDHLAAEAESERLVDELNRWERPVLVSAPADSFLDDVPWRGEEVRVWEIVTEQLVRCRWPRGEASRVVDALRGFAEKSAFDGKQFPSVVTVAAKLEDLPWGLSTPLARFLFAHHGFLWAILKGIDPNRALCLPAVREELERIVWPVGRGQEMLEAALSMQ